MVEWRPSLKLVHLTCDIEMLEKWNHLLSDSLKLVKDVRSTTQTSVMSFYGCFLICALNFLSILNNGCLPVLCACNKMEKFEVVPDVIDKVPPAVLNASYAGGVKVDDGSELTPTQVKDAPKVEWTADSNDFYTLVMVDPDAPSKKDPKSREWLHWLVVNIPGCKLSKGEVITEYVGAAPPEKTGLHRYVLLLYKQLCQTEFFEKKITNKSAEGREKFCSRKFAEKYNLCEPVAGNFFQAQYDSSVPAIEKQLKGGR
ncbi:hypothetical protein FQA39_LY11153 [Lamprigera yunnana]|nr:hypothetical protein FQA39_LY11153 [Lamprigera yunnana]